MVCEEVSTRRELSLICLNNARDCRGFWSAPEESIEYTLFVSALAWSVVVETERLLVARRRRSVTEDVKDLFDEIDAGRDVCTWKFEDGEREWETYESRNNVRNFLT